MSSRMCLYLSSCSPQNIFVYQMKPPLLRLRRVKWQFIAIELCVVENKSKTIFVPEKGKNLPNIYVIMIQYEYERIDREIIFSALSFIWFIVRADWPKVHAISEYLEKITKVIQIRTRSRLIDSKHVNHGQKPNKKPFVILKQELCSTAVQEKDSVI